MIEIRYIIELRKKLERMLDYENELYTELKKDILEVGKKTFINGKEGKVISSEPLLGKYKVLIDDEIIEIDINDSKK